MTPVTEEQLMRTALANLTDDQPPMPPGRFQAVRRRAIRHRKRQLSGALVSVLAVAGIVVGAARVPGILNQPPQARRVPGWALPWPDYRNGSVPQSVLNNAVLAWGDPAKYQQGSVAPSSPRRIARLVASYHVVWYVGQTVGHGQGVAVMFEANTPGTGRVLVVGSAAASAVMKGQPAWSGNSSNWGFQSIPAPARPQSFGPDISEYVPVPTTSGTASDNWIVVLPAPGSRFGGWAATTNTGRTSITGLAPHGVFVADAGQVTSDVALAFGSGPGDWVPVGLPGAPDVPTLAVPALSPPASFSWMDAYTGQGNELNDDSSVTRSGGPYAVLGSCYNAAAMRIGTAQPTPAGHGPVRITISGHTIGAITCDGQQHELAVPRSLVRRVGVLIGINSSMLTSWQVDFGRAH